MGAHNQHGASLATAATKDAAGQGVEPASQLVPRFDAPHARSPDQPPRLSAVWVFHGNEQDLEALARYLDVLAALPYPCELVAVGNGIADSRADKVCKLLRSASVPASLVRFPRLRDEAASVAAGFDAARGELVALLPTYLQADPECLREMVAKIDEGFDYVGSWRSPRVDSRWNALHSRLFNFIARRLTLLPLHDLNSTLRVMRREVASEVPVYGDLHRFQPVLAARQGFRIAELPVRHLEERVERGDYMPGVFVRRLLDLLTVFFLVKFTRKPLRFFGLIGSLFGGVGFLLLMKVVVEKMAIAKSADRPLLVLAVLLIVLGVELLSLGLLGELLIFTFGRNLPEYRVRRIFGTRDQQSASPPKSD